MVCTSARLDDIPVVLDDRVLAWLGWGVVTLPGQASVAIREAATGGIPYAGGPLELGVSVRVLAHDHAAGKDGVAQPETNQAEPSNQGMSDRTGHSGRIVAAATSRADAPTNAGERVQIPSTLSPKRGMFRNFCPAIELRSNVRKSRSHNGKALRRARRRA